MYNQLGYTNTQCNQGQMFIKVIYMTKCILRIEIDEIFHCWLNDTHTYYYCVVDEDEVS